MRFLLFDSGLKNGEGHHDHFSHGLSKHLRAAGITLVILAHKSAPQINGNSHRVEAVFSRSIYDPISNDEYDGELTSFLFAAQLFQNDLMEVGLQVREDDLLLIPTATPSEVLGLANWLDQQLARPRIALLFHWGNAAWLQPGSLSAALQRYSLRRILSNRESQVDLSATHDALATTLAKLTGRHVELAPSATFFEAEANYKQLSSMGKPENCRMTIGVLGALREGKGRSLLPSVIIEAKRLNLSIDWVIQCHGKVTLPREFSLLTSFREVQFINEWLNEKDMLALLRSIDVALLPYDIATYSAMVSGVFTIAAGYGIPCIVPNGTWMSDRIIAEEAAGIVYLEPEVLSIVTSIDYAYKQRDLLSAAAKARAVTWRFKYNANKYIDRLLAF